MVAFVETGLINISSNTIGKAPWRYLSSSPFNRRVLHSPAWCCSAHTCLIDPTINDAYWIVTGCLHSTPPDNLILAGIQPAELHHKGVTLSLACHPMEPGHLLHSVLTCPQSANVWHLKSRHPFVRAAQQLISLSNNILCAAHWAHRQWMWSGWTTLQDSVLSSPAPTLSECPFQEWRGFGLTASTLVSDISTPLQMGYGLLWSLWVLYRKTNCWQYGILMSNPSTSWIARPDAATIEWLLNTCLEIKCGLAVVWRTG